MSWRSGTEMRAINTGKSREEHSLGVVEKRRCYNVNRQPWVEKQQSTSRNAQSSSEIEPPLKTSSLISMGKEWGSVDLTKYADSEVLTDESLSDRQQLTESRDPQNDNRWDNVHVLTNGSERVDVDQIFQEMEQRMEQRFQRLDDLWNQIPLIMEQLQQHVDETKNMDSAFFQMNTHSIPSNDDEGGAASFSSDEAINMTTSASKELDNTIKVCFPRLRAYVSHLESTSKSAIAEILVDENDAPLLSSSSDETFSSALSCTESWDKEIDEAISGLSLLAELAVDEEVFPLLQEKASSSHSCTESLDEGIGPKAIWAQTRDVKESMRPHQTCIQKVTTKPSGDQAAYSCHITWVESPTSFTPRREVDSRGKVYLLQSKDRVQSKDRIHWDEVPIKSESREEIGSNAKSTSVKSAGKSENIQKQNSEDKRTEWERFVLSIAPSDESAGSTQSCTESLSTALLRAETYFQEANLCSVYDEDKKGITTQIEDEGIPAQTEPKLSKMPIAKQTRQTPQQNLVTKSSSEETEIWCHFYSVVAGLNANLERACLSCDRCLSVALNGSLLQEPI